MLDPDPDIVEIDLYAEPGCVEFLPGWPSNTPVAVELDAADCHCPCCDD